MNLAITSWAVDAAMNGCSEYVELPAKQSSEENWTLVKESQCGLFLSQVDTRYQERVRNCFGNSVFFFGVFFVLVGGGFRAVQAPFWESPVVKCRFRAGWTRKTAVIFPFISVFCVCVCVFMYVYVCECVCDRVCSICLVFLLLLCLFIQCTSFLVFAIYLFNV